MMSFHCRIQWTSVWIDYLFLSNSFSLIPLLRIMLIESNCIQSFTSGYWERRRSDHHWRRWLLWRCLQSVWSCAWKQGLCLFIPNSLTFYLDLVCEWVRLCPLPKSHQLELPAGEPTGSLNHEDRVWSPAQGGLQGVRLVQSHPPDRWGRRP